MAESRATRLQTVFEPIVPLPGTEIVPEEALPVKPKKKKLSKAERKLLKRQREIEFKKLEMEVVFKREVELSRKTAKRLKTNWEDTLREMKLEELREELRVWEQKAQRQFTEKDEKIESMLKVMTDFENMNQLISAESKSFFDYMTDIYKELTGSWKLIYENIASDAIYDFKNSLDKQKIYNDARQLNYENVMHTTNVIFENEVMSDYKTFVADRNDNVNDEIIKRYDLRDGIVRKMKESRKQLLNFVKQLTVTNLDPHKYERIHLLMNKQRMFCAEAQRLKDIENKHSRVYSELQRELLQWEMKAQKRINELRAEQSYFREIRKSFECILESDAQATFERLRILSTESYVVSKHFQKLCEVGELLLSLSANVQKFQTEAEKVVAWGDFQPTQNSWDEEDMRMFLLTEISAPKHVDRDNQDFFGEFNTMRIFWRRMGIAETQNALLHQEKLALLAENKKYTDFIRSMSKKSEPEKLLDAISVKRVVLPSFKCPKRDPF